MTDEPNLKGLGGWLILVGMKLIIMALSGIFLLITIIKKLIYSIQIDNVEYILVIFLIAINGYLIYLFFSKNYKFIFSFIVFTVLDVILGIVNEIVFNEYEDLNICYIMGLLLGSSIWIAYMLKSVRVKNTFINGHHKEKSYNNIIS